MRVCHVCGTQCESNQYCQKCVEFFPLRKPAVEMTVAERVAELRQAKGPLEIPFGMLHLRVEELVGRPVWTHELAFFDDLIAEVESGQRATLDDVIGKIQKDKCLVVVTQ